MNIVFLHKEEFFKDYQNVLLAYFRLHDESGVDEDIIMEFVKADILSFDEKSPPEDPSDWQGLHLPAFKYSQLEKHHFRQLNKKELLGFLDSYLKNPPWTDLGISNFAYKVGLLKRDLDNCNSDLYFVLSLDWFNEKDTFVSESTWIIYSHRYYLTILWIDKESHILSLCTLNAD